MGGGNVAGGEGRGRRKQWGGQVGAHTPKREHIVGAWCGERVQEGRGTSGGEVRRGLQVKEKR